MFCNGVRPQVFIQINSLGLTPPCMSTRYLFTAVHPVAVVGKISDCLGWFRVAARIYASASLLLRQERHMAAKHQSLSIVKQGVLFYSESWRLKSKASF